MGSHHEARPSLSVDFHSGVCAQFGENTDLLEHKRGMDKTVNEQRMNRNRKGDDSQLAFHSN